MKLQSTFAPAVDPTLVVALREHLRKKSGHEVALIETHISWVLLTDRLAYKLKKPVHLSFVDFSTLAARKRCCEEEVRLNGRLAPSIYLGVVPVCGTREAPYLGGGDSAIDFAVCMRRFPEDALVRNLLLAGRLRTDHLVRFGQRLAEFHQQAKVAPLFSDFGAPQEVLRTMNEALAAARAGYGPGRLIVLQDFISRRGVWLRTAWLERQREGAVRECHGDLHLANVVLIEDDLTAFDCIEFDPALRWIDVMSDVAFFTMDLKAHGRIDLAFRFLDAYLQHSGDYAGTGVLRSYEVYRALVRAMVACLRGRALDERSEQLEPDYLACAEALGGQGTGATLGLMITQGLSGSGKSTIAAELSAAARAIRIRSDVERKRIFGLAPMQRSANAEIGIYTPEATRRTFQRLSACARAALQAGYPVVVDAAFLRREERLVFRALAAELQVPFTILHCHASAVQLRQRVAARLRRGDDASEATLAVLEQQLITQEPLDDVERSVALDVPTDELPDIPSLLTRWRALVERLRRGVRGRDSR